MKDIEDNISVLVGNHFPDFYKEQGNTFVEFVKEYYKWAQESNNFIGYSRNLIEYRDIDKTIDTFLIHFKEKYLYNAPVFYDKTRDNIKHSLDFYNTKGTAQGAELLFKEVYSLSDVEVYYPGADILKPSDGEWVVPVYLEVSISSKTSAFLGKRIKGSVSNASAFVNSISRKSVKGKYFDVLFLADIDGDFVFDELITADGDLDNCPSVIGSLTEISIDTGGSDFSVGDTVNVISDRRGKLGKARVDAVLESTGKVAFTLITGGTGYGSNTRVDVANLTITVANKTSSNVFVGNFVVDETVYQPLANLVFNYSNTLFNYGDLVVGANSTANIAQGRVIGKVQPAVSGVATSNSTSNTVTGVGTKFITELHAGDRIMFQSCTTPYAISSITSNTQLTLTTTGPNVVGNSMVSANGSVLVIVNSGDFSTATKIAGTSANISSYTDKTATGKVIGANSGAVGFINVNNTFTGNQYNYIYGGTSNVYANISIVGTGTGATFGVGAITNQDTLKINTDIISGYTSIALNATSYGFPALSSANLSTIINLGLAKDSYQVGTIKSIAGVSSGNNYNITPFVLVRDTVTTAQQISGLYLSLDTQSGSFSTGETIYQVQSKNSFSMSVSGSNTTMSIGETVTQKINSTANVYGEVATSNTTKLNAITSGSFVNSSVGAALTGTVTSNSTSHQVNGTSTTFTTQLAAGDYIKFAGNNIVFQVNNIVSNTVLNLTTNSAIITSTNTISKVSNVAVGMSSGAYFFVNTAVSNTFSTTVKGSVSRVDSSYSNVISSLMLVAPITISSSIISGLPVTGEVSSATANVAAISRVSSSLAGNNAVVNVFAGIFNGAISDVSIINSGFAYEQNELITLQSETNPIRAVGYATLTKQGTGEGYFKSTRGFLNSDKYLHDGKFYQFYSYQVRTGVPLDVYAETLKKLSHIAGTRLFGNLVRTSNASVSITSSGVEINT
jgi:hypothetical protein